MEVSRVSEVRKSLSTNFYKFNDEVNGALIAVLSKENYILIGPPGTAKTMLVAMMSRLLQAKWFYRLLTKFTELEEIIGPINVVELLRGKVERIYTNTLVDSDLALLDEIFNASSAILNTLLTILNERVLYDGDRVVPVKTWTVFGASNRVPDEEELQALYDRFPLRVFTRYASPEETEPLIKAGWRLRRAYEAAEPIMTMDEVKKLNEVITTYVYENIDGLSRLISPILATYLDHITVSNRTRVKVPLYVVAYLTAQGVSLSGIDATSVRAATLKILKYLVPSHEQLSEYDAFLSSHMPGSIARLSDLVSEIKALMANNEVGYASEKLKEAEELLAQISSDAVMERFFASELAEIKQSLDMIRQQL